MALEVSKTKFGQTFDETYVMITRLQFQKSSNSLEAIVKTFPNENSRLNNEEPLNVERITIEVTDIDTEPNFFVLIYQHLKTLPEYESAIDLI